MNHKDTGEIRCSVLEFGEQGVFQRALTQSSAKRLPSPHRTHLQSSKEGGQSAQGLSAASWLRAALFGWSDREEGTHFGGERLGVLLLFSSSPLIPPINGRMSHTMNLALDQEMMAIANCNPASLSSFYRNQGDRDCWTENNFGIAIIMHVFR